ncbi:MAG: hypothetical protein HY674_20740 [Chloroflexi bacterium]|nr:hypothetical protein [Chloroflexota bacterium]
MNAKLLFKTLFLIIILALLVLMGLHNNDKVTFRLPPLVANVTQRSAIMYYAFFAIGLLTGTVLTAGSGRKGGGGNGSKASRSGK